jgi:hypothetical protein
VRILALIVIVLSTEVAAAVAVCSADIPPPQRFVPSKVTPGKSEAVLVISASDAIERGEQQRPSGAVFATDGYCSVIVHISAGPGANAILNVMGSSNSTAAFRGEWDAEIPPIKIAYAQTNSLFDEVTILLRHKVTEFFLSTPDSPGTPDVGKSVGGSILVYATGVLCSARTDQ